MKPASLLSLLVAIFSLAIPARPQSPAADFRAKDQPRFVVTPADSNCIEQDCSSSAGLAWTTSGFPDTRPGNWGTSDSVIYAYSFTNVPSGYQVKVLRVYGDDIAWIKGNPLSNSHAGVLFSMSSRAGNSSNVTNANSSCFLYHEGSLTSYGTMTNSFDNVTAAGGVLGIDNTLEVKLAIFLNDTGAAVFQDWNFVLVYRFVLVN